MIRRAAADVLQARLRESPAVGLVGARQVGKTTLARTLGGRYFDLEQFGERTRLDVEWDRVCAGPDLVVLDEAQAWPEVFPRLRGAIDAERQRPGRFLLLGSVSPTLMTHVAQSLAGRLALDVRGQADVGTRSARPGPTQPGGRSRRRRSPHPRVADTPRGALRRSAVDEPGALRGVDPRTDRVTARAAAGRGGSQPV